MNDHATITTAPRAMEATAQKWDLESLTTDLYNLGQAQAKLLESEYKDYLLAHCGDRRILRGEIRFVMEYSKWIPYGAKVLDWGCGPAIPSLVLSRWRPDLQLQGANYDTEVQIYPLLWEAARLPVTRLEHNWDLPFPDESFDVIIGKGVLEHVPNEQMSLAEVYRVLRDEGKYFATALPAKYSLLEWFNRFMHRSHHIRLYTLSGAKRLLLSSGFHIGWSGFRIACPLATPQLEPLFHLWEHVPIARHFTQNIAFMGVKSVHGMGCDQMYNWGNLKKTLKRFEDSAKKPGTAGNAAKS